MRAGGMLSEAVAPLFLLFLVAAHANALPRQYLPDIPGYIPVYIRLGDQPLEEINPALAEAFHESTGKLNNIQKIPLHVPLQISNKVLTEKNDVSLELEEDMSEKNVRLPLPSKELIYALPIEKHIFPQNDKSSEKESIIMKLLKSSPIDNIDLKKNTKEIKEGNK